VKLPGEDASVIVARRQERISGDAVAVADALDEVSAPSLPPARVQGMD
jgi:hypothetical protein